MKEFVGVQYGNDQEDQYKDIVKQIIDNGSYRSDRTGTGTISIFAPTPMKFKLDKFPLLTTKKMHLRPIFEELMWFIRGQTNSNILRDKHVHIWDANGSREFLDSRGLINRQQGDLGPVYGFQWRHFGAEYETCDSDYTGKGVDQLYNVIDSILFNPDDRRIILTAWNPAALDEMALPPCHMTCQFYVDGDKLSCQLYQRSADMGLGVPYNIASYALFVCMLAHVCVLKPGTLTHVMGDSHIYTDHINPLSKQMMNKPRQSPTLRILKEQDFYNIRSAGRETRRKEIVTSVLQQLESFEFDDIELENYFPWPAVQMKMSV